MKILPLAALLVLSTSACIDLNGNYRLVTDGYRFNYEGATAERKESGGVAAGVDRLEVDHRFGEVRVEAAPPGEATGWRWSAKVWADDPVVADMALAEVSLVVRKNGGTMEFELQLPETFKDDLRGLRSELTLLVDAAAELELENAHGDAHVSGIDGDVVFRLRHGDSHFADLAGELHGVQAHGELFAEGIQGAELETSHGKVTIRSAGPLQVKASHGDGSYDGIRGGLVLHQRHGDVEIHDGPRIQGESAHGSWRVMDVEGLDLNSSHGSVRARLLAGSAHVESKHGDVTIERAGVASDGASVDYIRCQHGDVKLDLRRNGYADIDVDHGDVTIFHAMGGGGTIEAKARHGDVTSDLPNVASMEAGQPGAKIRTSHGDILCVETGQQ